MRRWKNLSTRIQENARYSYENLKPLLQNAYPAVSSMFSVTFHQSSLPVIFRPIQESDLVRINELSNMPDISQHFETIPPVSMATTQAMWSYIQSGIVTLWGIFDGDVLIGGAGFYAQPQGTRLSHVATFFLYMIPEYWGKGIGRATIQFLEEEVRKRGYLKMECMVADTNPRAIRLYEKEGYEQEGRKKLAFFIDGKYADLFLMGKIL